MDHRLLVDSSSYSTIFKRSPSSLSAYPKRDLKTTVRANAGNHQKLPTATTGEQTASLSSQSQNPPQHLNHLSFPAESKPWVHFIGIGGYGLSALAFYALKKGWHVTGSDICWSKKLKDLQSAGATVYIGHHESHLGEQDSKRLPDHVVFSAAIPCSNIELIMAQRLGLKIHKRGSWLAETTHAYYLIAVSGSHGKSTTTAMLSMVLKDIDKSISAIVGADVSQFPDGGSVMCGSGSTFVLEADEYDSCFLSLTPQIALITNIEWEHVDIFPDEAAVKDLFRQFCRRLKPGGTLIFCGDSKSATSVASDFMGKRKIREDENVTEQVISYGLGEGNIWRALMIESNTYGGSDYVATCNGEFMARVQIQLPGVHNVLNSLAVITTAAVVSSQNHMDDSGVSRKLRKEAAEAASRSLLPFLGVRRRFEFIGSAECCEIYDDYAHHPTEVRASLEAAKQKFGQRPVWLVFQPHQYSRLIKLLKDFAASLAGADRVIVTEIYAAREKNSGLVSGEDLVNYVNKTSAVYIQSLDRVCSYLVEELAALKTLEIKERVVIITMGAGDVTNLGPMVLHKLSKL